MEGGRVSGLGGRHARRPIGLVYSPQDGSAGSARLGLGLIYGKAPCRRSEINGGRQQDLSKAGRTAASEPSLRCPGSNLKTSSCRFTASAAAGQAVWRDRKSTRLNSSHLVIS